MRLLASVAKQVACLILLRDSVPMRLLAPFLFLVVLAVFLISAPAFSEGGRNVIRIPSPDRIESKGVVKTVTVPSDRDSKTEQNDPAVDPGANPPVVDPGTNPPVVDPGTNPPVVDPGTNPPVVDPGTNPPVVDPGTNPPVVDPGTGADSGEIVFPASGASVRKSFAKRIVDRMRGANPGLEDYYCPFKAKAKIKYAFLGLPVNVEGTYYFKQPDKYCVKFVKAPEFLSKYPQVFGWSLPDVEKYSIRYFDGEGEFSDCFMLRLVPIEGRGDLEKIEMWISRETWLFPRQIYSYKNGGQVDIRCFYRDIDGFRLFDRMEAVIKFPSMGISGTAEGVYGEYVINSGLSDDIFKDSKSK